VAACGNFCQALVAALDADVTLLALGPESVAHRAAAADLGADIVFAPLKAGMDGRGQHIGHRSPWSRHVRELRPDVITPISSHPR